jgi:hypothetical protein
VPQLSEGGATRKQKPLEFLNQAAAVDESTVFRRTYPLGNQQELLVVMQQVRVPGAWSNLVPTAK